jgi:NAD(P)-dependent dehydrogenase (short-subunit alcohol dehydrogenase family)
MSRLVLVTGASRGLGRALALECARRGAHVVAAARTVGGLEELDDAIGRAGGAATLVPLDLTDEPALERLGAALHQRWGGLDLWLHAAAYAPPLSPADHVDAKDMERALALTVRATQRLIRSLAPLLRARRGRAALLDDPAPAAAYWGLYAASKAAQRALWEAWRQEARGRIDVRRATPPPMPTALRGRFYPGEDRAALTPAEAVAPRLLDALEGPAEPIDLRGEAAHG